MGFHPNGSNVFFFFFGKEMEVMFWAKQFDRAYDNQDVDWYLSSTPPATRVDRLVLHQIHISYGSMDQ